MDLIVRVEGETDLTPYLDPAGLTGYAFPTTHGTPVPAAVQTLFGFPVLVFGAPPDPADVALTVRSEDESGPVETYLDASAVPQSSAWAAGAHFAAVVVPLPDGSTRLVAFLPTP